jgi:chromate transporter
VIDDYHELRALAWVFAKLGVTAFGGPAAHIALMEHEVVRVRGWMTRERFVELLGASSMIPGPTSTELAIHIGRERAGRIGLVVAGACFILPAALLVAALAWAYVTFGTLPAVASVMYGVKPVIIAIVAQALWGLGRTAIKTRALAIVGVLALAAALVGVNPLLVLATAGACVAALRRARAATSWLPWPAFGLGAAGAMSFGLWPLFVVFLKIGSVAFGSGYVLLAFLRGDLVEHLHWLSESQLLDAVAVGQITPGPVFTTATFIGYVLGGAAGAAVATLAIFLPAFAFVAASGALLPWLRRSPLAAAVLDGINVGSLALMAAVTVQLGQSAIVDVPTAILAVASTVVLLWLRPSPTWLVLAGAAAGLARASL